MTKKIIKTAPKKTTMKKLLLVAALSAPLLSGCIVAASDGEVEHGWASE